MARKKCWWKLNCWQLFWLHFSSTFWIFSTYLLIRIVHKMSTEKRSFCFPLLFSIKWQKSLQNYKQKLAHNHWSWHNFYTFQCLQKKILELAILFKSGCETKFWAQTYYGVENFSCFIFLLIYHYFSFSCFIF